MLKLTKEDYDNIKKQSEKYSKDMNAFLRAIVANPGESCDEAKHVATIEQEMRKLDFDEVRVDNQGNVMGFMGKGSKIIAFDAHIDTVGIGNRANWKFDPYEGYENDTEIGGRGTSDQLGGIVSATYGARIMKDLDLIPEDYKIMVVGTVQEEDCDGNCWLYIIEDDKIRPEFVVSTEPTDGGIYRGQRGRMEIRIDVKGVSCHGSAPERGDNAAYKMAAILKDVEALNNNKMTDKNIPGLVKMLDKKYNKDYEEAKFLGRGTVTCSELGGGSPSRCAVMDSAWCSLDRRMTFGETATSCIKEIENLPSCKKFIKDVKVSMYKYNKPSYKNVSKEQDCFFPTWAIPRNHKVTLAMENAHIELFGNKRIGLDAKMSPKQKERRKATLVDKWTFSTNGVAIMGRHKIPVIGFGPGAESEAHAPNEKTWKKDLVTCAALYAALPNNYVNCDVKKLAVKKTTTKKTTTKKVAKKTSRRKK